VRLYVLRSGCFHGRTSLRLGVAFGFLRYGRNVCRRLEIIPTLLGSTLMMALIASSDEPVRVRCFQHPPVTLSKM